MMKTEQITPVVGCIIFDCDSVLLNTDTIVISTLLDVAEEYGLTIELDEAVWLFSEKGIEQNIIKLKNLLVTNAPDNFEEKLRKKIYQELKYGLEPKEGVTEMLRMLKLPFYVVSKLSREEIELNLWLTNLLQFFTPERIVTSSERGARNSNHEAYLQVVQLMGYEPEQCAVIVDSIGEIKNGLEDGFKVFGLTNGFNKSEMENLGAVILEEIKELPQHLKII